MAKKQKKSKVEQVVQAEAIGPDTLQGTNSLAPVGDPTEVLRSEHTVGKKAKKKKK